MKLFYTIIFCSISVFVSGQKLGPYTISSTGESFETADLSLYVSIGEPINTMISDGEVSVSQGILQVIFTDAAAANPPCATNNNGTLFFENCDDGQLYFFIKTEDGTIYDPYYADGVDFVTEEEEVQVKFGFIEATFETPCSNAEKAIVITCIEPVIVSSNDNLNGQRFEILPNPSQNTIKLFLNQYDQQSLTLQLFDMQGKLLLTKKNVKNEDLIDISMMDKGIYQLSIMNEFQQRRTVKLVKQ